MPDLDYNALTYGWFADYFRKAKRTSEMPKVRYFYDKAIKWQSADLPGSLQPTLSSSNGKANTLRRRISPTPANDQPDSFAYDPMNPVLPVATSAAPGMLYRRFVRTSARWRNARIFAHSTEPLKERALNWRAHDVTLRRFPGGKDTDFTVKLIDVDEQGRAYNLDEKIQRMRYREGWCHRSGCSRTKLASKNSSRWWPAIISPRTSDSIEISSSNFPRFDRNSTTGGNNYTKKGVIVTMRFYHSKTVSEVTITVIKRKYFYLSDLISLGSIRYVVRLKDLK